MMTTQVQQCIPTLTTKRIARKASHGSVKRFWRSHICKHVVLLLLTATLFLSSMLVSNSQPSAHAANPGAGNGCVWYRIRWGDTLTTIARAYHSNIWTLARVNNVGNINLIFSGSQLCIPYRLGNSGGQWSPGGGGGGVLANGAVLWYDYSALEWSTRGEVESLLRQAAANYGLPANLLLAIAWQESGWYQHVIAWDGGIGTMQLMPNTAMGINAGTGIRRNPYHLWDNINLGATYLYWLWHNFHGNLADVISAYNEGGWAVIHRGIFNWRYVDNVLYLMRRFG